MKLNVFPGTQLSRIECDWCSGRVLTLKDAVLDYIEDGRVHLIFWCRKCDTGYLKDYEHKVTAPRRGLIYFLGDVNDTS